MGPLLSRSVEINISNNTRNITLRNPRIHLNCGKLSASLPLELSPGSSDKCHFQGSYWLWGVAGVLAYEAESFTVAIHFSNPIDYNKFSVELGLELSSGKAHWNLEDTYERMAHGAYSSSLLDIKFIRATMEKGHATVQLSEGPVKVTATMSKATDTVLTVELEEEEGWREEARAENPHGVRHYQG